MKKITRYLLIIHELIWVLGSIFFLFVGQWMVRAFLKGDISFNVVIAVVPWFIFLISAIAVTGGFITGNPVSRKYYLVYGFLRSLYLAYLVYRGILNKTYELSAFFGLIVIIGLYAVRVVSNWDKSLEIADEYDAIIAQFDKSFEPRFTYTSPPPPPVLTSHEWYCTECGKSNPDNYKFCGECGKPRK